MPNDRCAKGQCVAGTINNEPIPEKDWLKKALAFNQTIADWNEKTKRFAVPHPGFCWPHKFCAKCGRDLNAFHTNNPYLSE